MIRRGFLVLLAGLSVSKVARAEEETCELKISGYKYKITQGADGQWYWKLEAGNGVTVADTGDGYSSKSNCVNGVENFKNHAASADITFCEKS